MKYIFLILSVIICSAFIIVDFAMFSFLFLIWEFKYPSSELCEQYLQTKDVYKGTYYVNLVFEILEWEKRTPVQVSLNICGYKTLSRALLFLIAAGIIIKITFFSQY